MKPDRCPLCGAAVEDPGLMLGPAQGLVVRNRVVARLSPLRYRIFDCLYTSRLEVCSRDRLIEHVYGDDDTDQSWPAISVAISHMRRILAPLGIRIENVRDWGFVLRFD